MKGGFDVIEIEETSTLLFKLSVTILILSLILKILLSMKFETV